MPVFGPPQVMFVRGAGTELFDSDGKRYLDFLCGLAVTSLGHANPAITEAITHQAGRLLHVSNFFTNDMATRAALELRTLLAETSGHDGQVFFCNSGAEANEAALKLARKFGGRGRHVVVSAFGSFHGRTLAALAATGQPAKHEPFQPMPDGFRHVAWGDLDALANAVDPSVAAVIVADRPSPSTTNRGRPPSGGESVHCAASSRPSGRPRYQSSEIPAASVSIVVSPIRPSVQRPEARRA